MARRTRFRDGTIRALTGKTIIERGELRLRIASGIAAKHHERGDNPAKAKALALTVTPRTVSEIAGPPRKSAMLRRS
jgi:hypothetical protein